LRASRLQQRDTGQRRRDKGRPVFPEESGRPSTEMVRPRPSPCLAFWVRRSVSGQVGGSLGETLAHAAGAGSATRGGAGRTVDCGSCRLGLASARPPGAEAGSPLFARSRLHGVPEWSHLAMDATRATHECVGGVSQAGPAPASLRSLRRADGARTPVVDPHDLGARSLPREVAVRPLPSACRDVGVLAGNHVQRASGAHPGHHRRSGPRRAFR
jgi:hypothetical protein